MGDFALYYYIEKFSNRRFSIALQRFVMARFGLQEQEAERSGWGETGR